MDIPERVKQIAEPKAEELGLELIDCEYKKEGGRRVLRLYIDKKGGVGLDDCEAVSRSVEPVLDSEDFIDEAYTFEVSSPGLDRPLKTDRDFARYEGEDVEVGLYAAIDGKKKFTGKLIGRKDGVVSIDCGGQTLEFQQKDISKVKRTIVW
ncbi:MAG: ribosome maturation factor RimP [Clostridia bacterium]|nr:ribosome maturation factor RimP [Clostridia bacterium]MBP5780385.1 ribosome maturation factor RimP [Clostridia bacterium]